MFRQQKKTVQAVLLKFRIFLCLAIASFLAGSQKALAHAVLVRSTPAAHAIVHGPNLQIVLHYNSRIDASRCSLTLTNAAGKTLPLSMTTPSGPAELDAHAEGLAPVQYVLHWQVLATDGHITRGEISFTVQ